MNRHVRSQFIVLLAIGTVLWFGLAKAGIAQDKTIAELRQEAISKAVALAKPAIVRLDIFSETHPNLKVATATLISKEGEMVTSSFFVPSKDTIITANLGDEKHNVRIIAQDLSRGLTLLKLDVERATPYVRLASPKTYVGQTAIAHGKTTSESSTTISVGIISALRRVWGKAIQTDAKVSPANYGGPLTDLAGNTLGILTSISPDGNGKGDAEWYDSGIGFAIPASDVARSVQKMKKEGDLYSGKIGLQFKDKNLLTGKLVVAQCFPRSPAAVAGIQTNDLIVRVGQQSVSTFGQFRQLTDGYYGGDNLSLTVKRGAELKKIELQLAQKLSVYKAPYLGIFPDYTFQGKGIKVDQVDPEGPAHSKIKPGSVITKIDDNEVVNVNDLMEVLAQYESGDTLELEVQVGGNTSTLSLTLDELIREVKSKSIPTLKNNTPFEVKSKEVKVSGFDNKCQVWFPAKTPTIGRSKCLVFLAKSSSESNRDLPVLKQLVVQEGHVLAVLSPSSLKGWQSDEKEYVNLAIRKINAKYTFTRTNCLLTHKKVCGFGMDLFREQTVEFGAFILTNPLLDQDAVLPFARPGTSVFTLVHVDKPLVIHGVKLQRKILQNGIPSKMIVRDPSDDDKKTAEYFRNWLRSTDRI